MSITSLRIPMSRALLAFAVIATLLATPAPSSAQEDPGDGSPGDEGPVDDEPVELPPGGTFADDDGNEHEGDIEAIAAVGVTLGCDDEGASYCPDERISRAQMAAFIVRAAELPASDVDAFDDDDGSPFEDDINAIAASGITQGCEEDSYCGEREVTRGELAAFLRRASGLPPATTDWFSDDDGTLFEDDINAITDAGIVVPCGLEDGFCADVAARRDEKASFLARFLGLDPVEVPEPLPEPEPEPEPVPEPQPQPADYSAVGAIAFWFGGEAERAERVARCESSLNPRAVNTGGGWYGLFQISRQYHRGAFERVTGQDFDDAILVAYYNAQYAHDLWSRQGWGPWGCKP